MKNRWSEYTVSFVLLPLSCWFIHVNGNNSECVLIYGNSQEYNDGDDVLWINMEGFSTISKSED